MSDKSTRAAHRGRIYMLVQQTAEEIASADACEGCAMNRPNNVCLAGGNIAFDECYTNQSQDVVWREVANEKEA